MAATVIIETTEFLTSHELVYPTVHMHIYCMLNNPKYNFFLLG